MKTEKEIADRLMKREIRYSKLKWTHPDKHAVAKQIEELQWVLNDV